MILLVFALIGSRLVGETVLDSVPPRRGDLSQQRLDDALQAIGLLNKPKADGSEYGCHVMIHGMPHRHNGGTRVVFDFPPGAKATCRTLQSNRELFAGQLGAHERMLVIREGDGAQQVDLWVADEDLFRDKESAHSPYATARRTNIWEGVRVGVDPMGEEIVIELAHNSVALGGVPQGGKSNVARILAAFVALDPYVDFVGLDGKGGIDFEDARPFAFRFVSNSDPNAVDAYLKTLEDLTRKMDATYALMREKGRQAFPEGRLTEESARANNIRPTVVVIDEIQQILAELGLAGKAGAFVDQLTVLKRKGPAAGIIVISVYHRPDAKSVPKGLLGATTINMATRCADRQSSDLILGEGSNAAGWNASRLPTVKGAGIVRTPSLSTEVRFDHITLDEFEDVCQRGMQLRAAANTLPDVADRQVDSIVDDVITILSEQGDLTPTALAAALEMPLKDMSTRLSKVGLKSRVTDTRRYHLADARVLFG